MPSLLALPAFPRDLPIGGGRPRTPRTPRDLLTLHREEQGPLVRPVRDPAAKRDAGVPEVLGGQVADLGQLGDLGYLGSVARGALPRYPTCTLRWDGTSGPVMRLPRNLDVV